MRKIARKLHHSALTATMFILNFSLDAYTIPCKFPPIANEELGRAQEKNIIIMVISRDFKIMLIS